MLTFLELIDKVIGNSFELSGVNGEELLQLFNFLE